MCHVHVPALWKAEGENEGEEGENQQHGMAVPYATKANEGRKEEKHLIFYYV